MLAQTKTRLIGFQQWRQEINDESA